MSRTVGLRQELWQRLATLWFFKMTATMAGIAGFLMAYFWVLQNPIRPAMVMPLTALDQAIGFSPAALGLYLSLWFYVSLGPALLKNRRELVCYGLASTAMGLLGLGIFVLLPTTVPAFGIDWSQHPSVAFLKDIDLAANACPSMHVAFAVFTAIWLQRLCRDLALRRGGWLANWLWCLGILYSTVAVRQHVVLDVVAGAALGAASALLSLWWLDAHRRTSLPVARH